MKHAVSPQSSYAALFDPEVARAVAQRAAHWKLPRHVCRPLDHHAGTSVSADLAAYDAAVDNGPVTEEELGEDPVAEANSSAGFIDDNGDAEDF